MKRRCPVCGTIAHPTRNRNVAAHRDRAGRDICPMTGHPYDLTMITPK